MAINLLPSEEKAKIKKEKQLMAPLIQMTGPVRAEKKPSPAIKGGGVLGFFKQAFQSPKKRVTEEDKALSEKKVLVEEKIIFQAPKEPTKPRVDFTRPIEPIKKPPRASGPKIKPPKIGDTTGINAGIIISLIAALVTISTHFL
jgi:hypothetical protein